MLTLKICKILRAASYIFETYLMTVSQQFVFLEYFGKICNFSSEITIPRFNFCNFWSKILFDDDDDDDGDNDDNNDTGDNDELVLLSFISNRYERQEFSQTSDSKQAGSEPVQNLSSYQVFGQS